jgi:hypothetical protein
MNSSRVIFSPVVNIRYNVDLQQLAFAQLGFGVEDADGIDVIAEELDPIGLFVAKGIDIEYSAAESDLTRFVDEVGTLEALID